jgi:hypothetical protein
LLLVESGFDRLAIAQDREPTAGFDSHSQGWTGELEKFRTLVERLPA